VWKVVQVHQGTTHEFGQELVLKDAWLGIDAQTEGEIIATIAANINSTSKTYVPTELEGPDRISRYFLSVVESEAVPSTFPHEDLPAGTGYCTRMYTRGNFLPDGKLTVHSLDGLPKASVPAASGSQPVPSVPGTLTTHVSVVFPIFHMSRKNFQEKKHCRVVFEQVGKDLYRADTLEEVIDAICDAATGTEPSSFVCALKCTTVADVGLQPYSTCLAQDTCIGILAPETSCVFLEVWGALQI